MRTRTTCIKRWTISLPARTSSSRTRVEKQLLVGIAILPWARPMSPVLPDGAEVLLELQIEEPRPALAKVDALQIEIDRLGESRAGQHEPGIRFVRVEDAEDDVGCQPRKSENSKSRQAGSAAPRLLACQRSMTGRNSGTARRASATVRRLRSIGGASTPSPKERKTVSVSALESNRIGPSFRHEAHAPGL